MNIDSIQNGIVIDHISAGNGMKLYELLDLNRLDCSVALLRNVSSQKLGRKDIIKIDQEFDLNLDLVGFVDPQATVVVIKNGEIVEKKKLDLPEVLINVIRCKNPRCITQTEQEIVHEFRLSDRVNRIYRCIYCETKA
ncbi:MAG: aspartate carbamoyltransferase regulatory subunit [Erysipelotrichaceae bacterium]|jgi:aspartate carbamoyltransferase regulatory subunit|nr:aspartate carbamoyltransferase regulatory subunit [Erysipelotrichaceae bacterium]